MVKESNKKRKLPPPDPESDLYRKSIENEEKQALKMNAVKHRFLYLSAIKGIHKLVSTLKKLMPISKSKKNMILQLRTKLCILIISLKRTNRLSKFRLSATRDGINEEKLKFDSVNLKLQNYLYEDAHLCSEIEKCRQYRSKDEELELISIDEYLTRGPTDKTIEFKDKELNLNSKHLLHLAMLEFELSERIEVSKLCDSLDNEMKQIAKSIKEKTQKLRKLTPMLRNVLDTSKDLQEELNIPVEKIKAEHKLANLLPDQLYLLFCYGSAFKEVNPDIGIQVEIEGDQEDAVQYNELAKLNDGGSDLDIDTVEEPTEGKKRRHRKNVQVDKNEEKKKKLLESHPLLISLCFNNKDGAVLKIKFQYRTQLKIITLNSTVDLPSNITGNSSREVLTGESILNELFEGDTGIESPRLCNKFLFKKLSLGSYESLLPKLGYAYMWAQKLGGLEYLNTSKIDKREAPEVSMENTLLAIKRRFVSRVALANQLQQLEQNIIPEIPNNMEHPKMSVSELTKFTSIPFQKFCEVTPNISYLIESEIATKYDLFFTVNISRQKVVLSSSILIKCDYPMKTPIFILYMDNGKVNAGNSDEIRDMERAVNTQIEGNVNNAGWLLSIQLKLLCSYFDVYIETMENPNVPRSRLFFRKLGGRNRKRPFRFQDIGNGDLSVFTQY